MTNLAIGLERLRPFALGLIVAGQIAAVVGLIGIVRSTDEPSEPVAELVASSTTQPVVAATEPPTTPSTMVAPTSELQATTTTSILETTTSTEPPVETLDDFVSAFNVANSAGDTTFALERLHPVVIEIFTTELCQGWLEARFASTTIEIIGEPTEPTATLIDAPAGQVEVHDYFTASALLTFQGSVTETTASFGYVDGAVYWFTNCEAS